MFVRGDIGDRALVDALLAEHRPRAIVNFAAESHVDRSIHGPAAFIQTNVVGTFALLEAARAYWCGAADGASARAFRFLHVSTDEVYGSLGRDDPAFTETTPYAPNSPYSASKAASDHLVRAYHHTYGLPTLTTNCSNNYGPFQFPGEADPADDRQRARRQAAAGLRRRPATCATGCTSSDHCAAIRAVLAARPARARPTTSAATTRCRNIDVVHDDLRAARRAAAARRRPLRAA